MMISSCTRNKQEKNIPKKNPLTKEKIKEEKEKKRRKRQQAKELEEQQKIERDKRKREEKIQQKLNNIEKEQKQLWKSLTNWLTEEVIDKIAILTGYGKKSNTQILPLAFVLTMVWGMFGDGAATYSILIGNLGSWFSIKVSSQALFNRLSRDKSVLFLKKVLMEAMECQLKYGSFKNRYGAIFSHFTAVELEDSTQFNVNKKVCDKFKGSGGSASAAKMKMNVVYDITRAVISKLDIVSGAICDQALGKDVRTSIKKGVLRIRDLGYFNIVDMVEIIKKLGFFLSRLKKDIKIFLNQEDKNPINIYEFLKEKLKNGGYIDQIVYIGNEKLAVRMVAEKVPENVKKQRIASYKKHKIKRDKKKTMKADYVEWFGYSIFVTNASHNMLGSANMVMATYKIRWQIELFFKRIKSILDIDVIKGKSVNRVLCIIYSKLCSLLIAQSIISFAISIADDDEEVSEYKFLQWLKNGNRLGNAIISGAEKLEELFHELIRSYYTLCKNKRKSKSTLRMLEEAASYEKMG